MFQSFFFVVTLHNIFIASKINLATISNATIHFSSLLIIEPVNIALLLETFLGPCLISVFEETSIIDI